MLKFALNFLNQNSKLFNAAVILIGVILVISSSWNESPVIDEIVHIGAGYSYLATQNMRLNPEHPPLVKDLAAFPLIFLNLNRDSSNIFKYHQSKNIIDDQWILGYAFLYKIGNNAIEIVRIARLPIILFFILTALLIARWANELYGRIGACLALISFCFSPTVIAHSGLVTTDMPVLAGILFSSYFFIKYLKKQTTKNFITTGLVVGFSLLTKFSALLLIPFFILLAIIYGLSESGSVKYKLSESLRLFFVSVTIFIIGFTIVVWPVYLVHLSNYDPIQQNQDTQARLYNSSYPLLAEALVWMSDEPLLRAVSYFGVGLISVLERTSKSEPIYFLGKVDSSGQKKYFPVIYSLKEPLPWLILVALSVLIALWRFINKENWTKLSNNKRLLIRENFVELGMLFWVIFYSVLSVNSKLNIGIRHLLPMYPFMILLVAGQISGFGKSVWYQSQKVSKFLIIAVIGLLGWYIFEAASIYPYYLTYFNQLIGGPSNGWRYAVDSNLDWGQDLQRFNLWLIEKNISQIEFGAIGPTAPDYYLGEKYVYLNSNKYRDRYDFIERNKTNGWIALSATQYLQLMPNSYPLWLKSIEPVTVIGNSIFVWHITK